MQETRKYVRVGPCFAKLARSTVGDTEAIVGLENQRDSEMLLVPRGGIEPPTRGFSVASPAPRLTAFRRKRCL